MKTILAIDPGANGGMAVYSNDCANPVYTVGFTGMTTTDIINEFKGRYQTAQPIAVLEELQKFSPMPAAKMAVYAASYGMLHGALIALGYRVETVRAQKWQKELSVGTKGDMTSTKWKQKLKERAQRLYPSEKVTLQTADALLILEWARRNGLSN